MALNKPALKNAIKTSLDDLATRTENPEQARNDYAEALANAIDAFVKSGDGKYQPGTLQAGPNTVTAISPGAIIKIE